MSLYQQRIYYGPPLAYFIGHQKKEEKSFVKIWTAIMAEISSRITKVNFVAGGFGKKIKE